MNWRALMGGGSTPEPYPHNSHNPQKPQARGNSGDIGNIGDGVSGLEAGNDPAPAGGGKPGTDRGEALDSGDSGNNGDGVSESIRTLARQKLATVCRELGADLAGALDWYKDDAEDLAELPMGTVRDLVADALQQRMIPRATAPLVREADR